MGNKIDICVLCLVSIFFSSISTADVAVGRKLQTWFHDKWEYNTNGPVSDDAVRASPFFGVRIEDKNNPEQKQYDAFVYMTIPRGGREKWGYINEDGAEFSSKSKLTMSWASFIYQHTDCWVYINFRQISNKNLIDRVNIRPSTFNFKMEQVDDSTIRVLVPYSIDGYRFSVEITDYLYTAYNDMDGYSGHLVELSDSGPGSRKVHTEPRNALLIFAEPRLDDIYEPRVLRASQSFFFRPFLPLLTLHDDIYSVSPGLVDNLDDVTASIIYFQPGVYYMPWNYHAKLSQKVKWVHLAPGAYVKGAFQFMHDTQKSYKFTGFGIVSGEKYVYEADVNNYYQHKTTDNCHGTCVKLLRLCSSFHHSQKLDLHGVTFVEPPYHSFVVYGDEETFKMNVTQFKMVGGWYWQTDGIELYANSVMKNVFFHSNDDVLKIYHDNLQINNVVIWKNENGPVIQWGWASRNIQNVLINNTYVIHNKMYWHDVKKNTCLINSCGLWSSDAQADTTKNITNIMIENLFVEGMINCAIRLFLLSNTYNIHIKNLQIDSWNNLEPKSQANLYRKEDDNLNVGHGGKGLSIFGYYVGGEMITENNFRALGRIDFDQSLKHNWYLM